MSEPLRQSSTASTLDGPESLKLRLREVNARILARRREQPKPIAASIPSLKGRCGNSKVPTRRPPGDREAWEVEQEVQRRADLYAASGCPKRHTRQGKSIDDDACPPAWREAREKIAKALLGGGCLIALLGRRGPGKTQLAQIAIKATCDRNKTALYCVAIDVFVDLRDTYGTEASERSVINYYSQPALLVIDELQERGNTPWEDRVLHHLIDVRYRAETDTLLLANLGKSAFKESMGASVTERLNETGGIIECTWASFRK